MTGLGSSLRVLLADEVVPQGVEILRATEGLAVDDRAGIDASELAAIIGDYDALIVRSRTKVTREILETAKKLRVVGRAGVGVDNIDLDIATRQGVVVLNTPGANVISVAEHTLGLMLALVRHIAQGDTSLRRGEWERQRFQGIELYGKTLGLVGAGRIGSEVGKRAQAFGMRVVAYDPYLSHERAGQAGIEFVGLPELLEQADVVSVHVPLTEETRAMIGSKELALMKPAAYLINVARGGVVDEAALVDALRGGNLAGAALDVFEEEPVSAENPLLGLHNVVAVPHLGAATLEARTRTGIEICESVRDALVKGDFRFAVNVC